MDVYDFSHYMCYSLSGLGVAVGDTGTLQPPVVIGMGRRRIPSHEGSNMIVI